MRKYDLLAISLLVFSAIVVTAMSVDPNHFSIKDWQPLMAVFVALGAAGVAYQGVTLTYKAAIRKVDLDRSIHEQECGAGSAESISGPHWRRISCTMKRIIAASRCWCRKNRKRRRPYSIPK
jgi:hypothetical protein